MLSRSFRLSPFATHNPLTHSSSRRLLLLLPSHRHTLSISSTNLCCCRVKPIKQNNGVFSVATNLQSSSSLPKDSPFSGLEDVLLSYLFGKKRATDVAHMVWKHVVQKGDTVIDATCGNGFDTLALLNLIADDSHNGCVYAMDVQKDALDKTSFLLEESVNSNEVWPIKK